MQIPKFWNAKKKISKQTFLDKLSEKFKKIGCNLNNRKASAKKFP